MVTDIQGSFSNPADLSRLAPREPAGPVRDVEAPSSQQPESTRPSRSAAVEGFRDAVAQTLDTQTQTALLELQEARIADAPTEAGGPAFVESLVAEQRPDTAGNLAATLETEARTPGPSATNEAPPVEPAAADAPQAEFGAPSVDRSIVIERSTETLSQPGEPADPSGLDAQLRDATENPALRPLTDERLTDTAPSRDNRPEPAPLDNNLDAAVTPDEIAAQPVDLRV